MLKPIPAASQAGCARPESAPFCYTSLVDEANKLARAAARRSTWTGGVAKVSDMAAIDRAFWSKMTPVARLQSIWSIVEDSLALGGDHGPTPRLQRTVGGVRRRKG
jgi:hypothetical protein